MKKRINVEWGDLPSNYRKEILNYSEGSRFERDLLFKQFDSEKVYIGLGINLEAGTLGIHTPYSGEIHFLVSIKDIPTEISSHYKDNTNIHYIAKASEKEYHVVFKNGFVNQWVNLNKWVNIDKWKKIGHNKMTGNEDWTNLSKNICPESSPYKNEAFYYKIKKQEKINKTIKIINLVLFILIVLSFTALYVGSNI